MQLTLHGDPQLSGHGGKGEFTELLGIPRETLAPLNSAVPPSSPGDGRRPAPTPSTHLLVSQHLLEASTFSEMQPGPRDRLERNSKEKNSLNNEKISQTAECESRKTTSPLYFPFLPSGHHGLFLTPQFPVDILRPELHSAGSSGGQISCPAHSCAQVPPQLGQEDSDPLPSPKPPHSSSPAQGLGSHPRKPWDAALPRIPQAGFPLPVLVRDMCMSNTCD